MGGGRWEVGCREDSEKDDHQTVLVNVKVNVNNVRAKVSANESVYA